jgi:uncharacterized Fe-S center protein
MKRRRAATSSLAMAYGAPMTLPFRFIMASYCKEAYIGRAVMDADIFISLTHFKGHEEAGFGGTIKNIGMGCGSRAGKCDQHASGKTQIDESLCRGAVVARKSAEAMRSLIRMAKRISI